MLPDYASRWWSTCASRVRPTLVGWAHALPSLLPSGSEAHGLRSWPEGLLGLKSLKASLTPVGPPSARECGGYLVLSEPQVRFGPHVHGEQVQFGLSQPTDWMDSLLPPFGADTRRCRGRRKTQRRLADPKISATFAWTSTVVNARG